MRKLLLSTALTLGVSALALQSPAVADSHLVQIAPVQSVAPISVDTTTEVTREPRGQVVVTAYIDKDKDKRVLELIAKLKVAVVIVFGVFTGKTAAESDLIADQQNVLNTVNHPGIERLDVFTSVSLSAVIENSVNRNTGVTQLNQDTGNMVNQANILSAAVSRNPVFADSQAAAQQDNLNNTVTTRESPLEATEINAQKTALITNSINTNTGVTMVNQNVGNMNNQLNAVSLAVGLQADFALADAALGQFNTGNTVTEFGTIRTATIINSINGNTGVTAVNQATGNMNNQGTVISFAGSAQF